VRISLVEAMFSDRRKKDDSKRIDGKTEKLVGFSTYIDTSRIVIERVILSVISRSIIGVGSGTMITMSPIMTPSGKTRWLCLLTIVV